MRYLILLAFLICTLFEVNAQCNKIHFVNTSLSYAQQKARKEKKNIFIFVYELGESKAEFFESAIFYKSNVCKKFNEEFINVKVKSTSSLGKSLIRKHRLENLPAFIMLDERGSLVVKSSKIKGTSDLLRFADRAR